MLQTAAINTPARFEVLTAVVMKGYEEFYLLGYTTM
jgi:hypothetical protein